jgi:hypothetical protein
LSKVKFSDLAINKISFLKRLNLFILDGTLLQALLGVCWRAKNFGGAGVHNAVG